MTNSTMSVLAIEKAVSVLRSGGVIALPTDTLYALAAAARDAEAVRRVFAIKGREGAKPLPLFVSDLAMAERVAVFSPTAHRLAERFWPGPLTIALPRQPVFESEALAGGDTVAVRVPDYEFVRRLVRDLGWPVTGTSANRAGARAPVSSAEAAFQLGEMVDLIIDGGRLKGGAESTVVDITVTPPAVLREGAVRRADVETVLRQAVSTET